MHRLDCIFKGGLVLLAVVLPVSIAGTSLVMFPLFALWVVSAPWSFRLGQPRWTGRETVFAVFFTMGILSSLLGPGLSHSWHDIQKDLYYIMVPFLLALITDREQALKLLNIFVIATLITAVIGIIQYLIGVDQIDQNGQIYLNVPKLLSRLPAGALHLFSMNNGRVQGTRSHPLHYSEVLVLAAALSISRALLADSKDAWRSTIVTWVIVLALLLSKSRGPWLGCVAAGLTAAVIVSAHRPSFLVAKRVLILAAPILFFVFMPALRSRAGSIGQKTGNEERLHMWRMGWTLFKDHPFFGVGPGGVKPQSVHFQTLEEQKLGAWGHLHSTYVNFGAERGLVGLLSFAALTIIFFRELSVGLRSTDPVVQPMSLGGMAALVGFLVFGLTETAYDSTTVLLAIYFVLGVSLAALKPRRTIA